MMRSHHPNTAQQRAWIKHQSDGEAHASLHWLVSSLGREFLILYLNYTSGFVFCAIRNQTRFSHVEMNVQQV